MHVQFPDGGDRPLDPQWLRPLYLVWPAIPALPPLERFDPDDFMVMGRVLRAPRPDITLYKHRFTRRYLNVDAAGRTYRYAGPPSESFRSGEYRRQDLVASLRALGLGELPDLKAARAVLDAHERPRRRGDGGRGHLRLV